MPPGSSRDSSPNAGANAGTPQSFAGNVRRLSCLTGTLCRAERCPQSDASRHIAGKRCPRSDGSSRQQRPAHNASHLPAHGGIGVLAGRRSLHSTKTIAPRAISLLDARRAYESPKRTYRGSYEGRRSNRETARFGEPRPAHQPTPQSCLALRR